MHLKNHVRISLGLSAILYLVYRKWEVVALCMVSGVLVDLDHLLDTFLYKKKWVGIREFFRICNDCELPRVFLFLHSIELAVFLAVLTVTTGFSPLITSIASGFIVHLLCDIFSNSVNTPGYFLCLRIRHRFSSDFFFKRKPSSD